MEKHVEHLMTLVAVAIDKIEPSLKSQIMEASKQVQEARQQTQDSKPVECDADRDRLQRRQAELQTVVGKLRRYFVEIRKNGQINGRVESDLMLDVRRLEKKVTEQESTILGLRTELDRMQNLYEMAFSEVQTNRRVIAAQQVQCESSSKSLAEQLDDIEVLKALYKDAAAEAATNRNIYEKHAATINALSQQRDSASRCLEEIGKMFSSSPMDWCTTVGEAEKFFTDMQAEALKWKKEHDAAVGHAEMVIEQKARARAELQTIQMDFQNINKRIVKVLNGQ